MASDFLKKQAEKQAKGIKQTFGEGVYGSTPYIDRVTEYEQARRDAEDEWRQRQYAQFQAERNAEIADWIKGTSPLELEDKRQQQRLDYRPQYEAQQNRNISEYIKSLSPLEIEKEEQQRRIEEQKKNSQRPGPYAHTPEMEAQYLYANGVRHKEEGPYKLTPEAESIYQYVSKLRGPEPEPETYKPEPPVQKLTPDVEAERLRRLKGEEPGTALTPYKQYMATYNAQQEQNAKKVAQNAESAWPGVGRTVGGMTANFISGAGQPIVNLARGIEGFEDMLYRVTGNETFNLDRRPGLRNSEALKESDQFAALSKELREKVGPLGQQLIDAAGAAGNMLASFAFFGMGASAAGNPVNATARMANMGGGKIGSALGRLGARVGIEILSNPGNFGISLGSGISSYSEAYANGAGFGQALTNGLLKGMTEYYSNKLFSGTPYEDSAEKGYVTKLIEQVANDLGGSEVLRYINETTGGRAMNWIFDKAGEGLEEVVTGVMDPLIDRITYDRTKDLATAKELTDEFIGGVLLSFLMEGGEAVISGLQSEKRMTEREAEARLVKMGFDAKTAKKYSKDIAEAITAMLQDSQMRSAEYAEKSIGDPETAAKGASSDSEAMQRYAAVYNREDSARGLRRGANPAEVDQSAFLTENEAKNYFYIWNNQGAEAADAFYEQYLSPVLEQRRNVAMRQYIQQAFREWQAEDALMRAEARQREEEALARQTQAEETLAQQGPPIPQNVQGGTANENGAPLFQSESGEDAGPLRSDTPSGIPNEAPAVDATVSQTDNAVKGDTTLRLPSDSGVNETVLWTAPKNNGGWKRQYNGPSPMIDALRATNPALLEAYMAEGTEGNTDTPIIDAVTAVYEDVRQGTISPMAGAALINKMWMAGQNSDSQRAYLQSIYNPNTGNLTAQALNAAKKIDAEHRNGGLTLGQVETSPAAAEQQAIAGQADNSPAAAAAKEAGNDLADGGRGRIPGQRAGEQNGRLAEAKQAVSQYNKASGRRADAKNLRAEEVDARERIPEAAKGSKITLALAQMVQQDKELRTVAQRLEQITGKKVYYTIGNIQRQGAGGRVSQARGAITADGIYLRCDHNDLSVTQLAAHELYHYYEQLYPGLSARMKEKIIQTYSEEEFNKVAKVYVEKLGAINGLTDNQDALAREEALAAIEKEIFADAFGSINYGGAKADRFNALVRQTLNETMETETEAATARKTGPPTQFSTQEEVLARSDVDWMDDFSSIKEQITKHAEEINKMRPVAEVEYRGETGTALEKLIREGPPKIGGEFMSRNGIGFDFDKTGINNVVHHAADRQELLAAALAAPYVAKYGKMIAGHKNHENTGMTTVTFAAPVILNGDTVNEGVTIQFSNRGRPRATNVELQSGGVFKLKKIEAPKGSGSLVYRFGKGKALPTMGASAETIAEKKPEVKTDFSADEDTDAEYNSAVKSGDMETAQRMVDEAAETSMPNSKARTKDGKLMRVYHGTQADFNEFDTKGHGGKNGTSEGFGIYLTDSPDVSKSYGDRQISGYANIERPAWSDRKTIKRTELARVIKETCVREAKQMMEDDGYRSLNEALRDTWISNYVLTYEYPTMQAAYTAAAEEIMRANDNDADIVYELINGQGIRDYGRAMDFYHDVLTPTTGIDGIWRTWKANDAKAKDANILLAFESSQIKSADPVTYDDAGNIIPLSERFNPEKQDIRWSADEEEEIPQSAAEYAQMKQRAKEREAELRRLEKKGEATAEQRREAAELRKQLQAPKAAVKKQQATIAKKQLRNTIISEFGIPDGRKAEIGKMIDAYADRLIKEKEISWSDRLAFFKKLYDEGVMTVPADDMYQAAREIVRGGKVYVSEKIKHEFGDDWASFRRQAFAEGIYLTNNPADKSADSWNVELSSEFPGVFPEDNYDQKDILERIVSAAQAGRDEQMSLAEYAAKVVGQEYVSEDEAMDNMERRLDWALRSFADKAGLETWLKDKAEEKLAKQREQFGERLDAIRAQEIARQAKERDKRKEAARKQTLNRELREMQQRTLKQLQWLSKNRQKFSGDMKGRLDEILSDIDVYAISAADEAHLDKASNKTWRELADIYKDARENDPNFLPSKDLERIVARLDNRKIGDMDIDAVTDLYKAAVGLRTELYNRNNVIGSELHETFQEVYDQVKDEMQKAKGGYQSGAKGTAQKFFSDLQLTPMNVLERMAGWNKDSAWYKMAKQLEQGERAQRKFKTDSARMLAPFLEEHKEWVKKADGQGKDAIWYEVEVPELLELGMGDKPIFGNTVKVYMTPAQKVHMYLESQNYDNLRHMTGGRTFADKELYSKGKRAEAFAQGKTIRLAPETVKNLVKDLTPEEKALADALRPFYNEFSKKEINRVSNLLLGYNKAMEGDYAPIYTNKNYTKSEPGIFDTTAEGVGNLKSRVVSATPSLNISALDAFEKSVDRTSRYVGLAIPVRNMNTLMNWREKGNSMADVLTHKWGEDGKRFVNDLLTELQSGRETEQSSIEKLTNAALSRYISAVFGANPSIVTKQFASYPLAAAYLGWDNMPLNVPRAAKVDTDLIAKYTGEYDYRQLGYAMPETATLKDNPGKLQERGPLNFIFGGGAITWMDGFTVRTLWTWAENKVNKEQPGLEKGSQADIDAGNSEYYKAVATEFEEALSRSQPMYDTMHRANIMRESNPITRAFTLFKTVPMQEYNMLRQAIGEAQYAKEAKLDKETQAAARQKAGRAFAGILAGNLMIGAITILNALWKNRGKKYRDEDGELSAEKLIAEAGKQYFKDAAGLVIGGGEAADILSSILFGDKWYGLETPGMEQIGSILEQTVKAGQTVQGLVKDSIEVLANGGNWAQYMADHSDKYISAVDSVARTLGTYATGLPIDNVKAYLLGAVQWLSPEVKTAYEDIMDKADRSGLKGLSGASLEIRTKHILQERAGSAEDSTAETLAGLYAAGYKDAIPAAQQTKVSVDGEERKLNLAQQQTYKKAWQETVGGSIDELVSSKAFQEADEKTQAKMLKKLYDLATDRAKSALFDNVEDNTWDKAQEMLDAGLSLEDYVSTYARFNAIKNDEELSSYERGKQQREMISGMDYSDEAKLALYESLNPTATSRIEKFQTIMDTGMDFDDVMKVYDKYSAIDERGDLKAGEKEKDFTLWVDTQKYSDKQKAAIKDQLKYGMYMSMDTERYDKLTGKGLDPTTAYNVDQAISSLTPKAGKESVSDTQKWQAAMKNTSGETNQKKALEALMTEEQYAKFLKTGVSASAYVNYRVAVSDLSPLPGRNGVTNAQKWNAALKSLGTNASKKDKLALVGDIVGTDMTTKTGEPTLWSKINRVVDSGKSVEDTMKLAEEEKLDVYVKWMDSDAKAAGIKSDTYIAFREKYNSTKSVKDENGKDVKGQTKKDQIMAYIDGLDLTRDQKDTLFLENYAESGLKDTPWHKGGGSGKGKSYAMAKTPALRLPDMPKAEKPSSGLSLPSMEETPKQSSGLRLPSTPSETRQSSGLRIKPVSSTAPRQFSGLRLK